MGSPRNEKTADLSPKDASTTWIPVLPSANLPENAQQIVDILGMSVLLIRYRNTVLALENRCPYHGASLYGCRVKYHLFDGLFTVRCPKHKRVFTLAATRSLSLNAFHSQARNPFHVQELEGWIWLVVKTTRTLSVNVRNDDRSIDEGANDYEGRVNPPFLQRPQGYGHNAQRLNPTQCPNGFPPHFPGEGNH